MIITKLDVQPHTHSLVPDFLADLDGDKYMLMDVLYFTKRETGEDYDLVTIVYKELATGIKYTRSVKNPPYRYFVTKPEYQNYNYVMDFIPLSMVDMVECPFGNLSFHIAETLGGEVLQYVRDCMNNKTYSKLRNVHKHPYVFGSDYTYEDWIRIVWALYKTNDKPKEITKAFLDIETDLYHIKGFPKHGECAVNMLTIVDQKSKNVYTLLLRDIENKNPLIADFETRVDTFIKELEEEFEETYGKLNYSVFMYDDELELIKDAFKVLNTLKRDFVYAWNQEFDFLYLIERIKVLGGTPESIMTHPDFPVRMVYYKKDTNNMDFKNRQDYLKISSYSVYMDQMSNYAGLRKGQKELSSVALNAVAQKEIGDEKLDYGEAEDIRMFPYIDFMRATKYNIKDVLLQYGIDNRTADGENIFQRSYANATPYSKIFRQTVFIRNRAYVEFFLQGVIIGNNGNADYSGIRKDPAQKKKKSDEEDEGYDGGFVSNPLLNSYTGVPVLGRRSMFIYSYVVDFDFSSMYPRIIIAFNICPNSLICKIIIDKHPVQRDFEHDESQEISIEDFGLQDDAGKEFVDNYHIGNPLLMCNKWFGLPTFDEMAKRFEYQTKNRKVTDLKASYNTTTEAKELIEIG